MQLSLALWIPTLVAVVTLAVVAITTAQQSEQDRRAAALISHTDHIQTYLDAVENEGRAAYGLSGMSYKEAAAATDAAIDDLFTMMNELDEDGDLPANLRLLARDARSGNAEELATMRMAVSAGLPAASTLGFLYEMHSTTAEVPQLVGNDVSSAEARNQLSAMGSAWDHNVRLNDEALLVELWLESAEDGTNAGGVTASDIATAIRNSNVADRNVMYAFDAIDTTTRQVTWSDGVAQMRNEIMATNGYTRTRSGQVVPITPDMYPTVSGEYLTEATNRVTAARENGITIVNDGIQLSTERREATTREMALMIAVAVIVLILAIVMMIQITRRIVNPVVTLVAATRSRAKELPRHLEAIESGEAPEPFAPITVPKAGPELREFAAGLDNLVGTAVGLASKEAQQRTAVVGMLRTVAHRQAALVNRQLELLDKYERHEVDPVFLSRLFNLDHVTTQMRRMCDSLLVLAGASPVRRTTPPLSLVDVVRGASSQIQQYSRVDLDVWYDPRVHGHKVSDLTLLLAELLDNATKYSHPDSRVTVTFTRGQDAALITVADDGIGFDDSAMAIAQATVNSTDPDHFEMFDRLGLQTVARLCLRTGVVVSFTGGSQVTGTRVVVEVPDALLADPGAGVSMRLATTQVGETFDDSIHRPASMTLYGQRS